MGIAVGLEIHAAWSVAHASVATAGSVHLLGAGILAFALTTSLPPGAIEPRGLGRFALFCFAFFIPVIGPAGLAIGLTWAVHGRKKTAVEEFLFVRPPELPVDRPEVADHPRRSSVGALALTLNCARDPDERVAAVMACRRLGWNQAAPLLRVALRDPVDEVRLLAYALMSRIDKQIGKRIQDRLRRVDRAPPPDRARLHRALALDFWDLAFFGLVGTDVETHVLDQALRHLEHALDIEAHAGCQLLLGRIRLRQGRPADAEAALSSARALGMPQTVVLPYQAEAAFQRRDFHGVRDHLSQLPPSRRGIEPLAEVIRFWLGDERTGAA